jgi:hypothetical protein
MADNDMTVGPTQVMPDCHGDRPGAVTAPSYQNGKPVTLADVKNNDGLAWQNMPTGPCYESEGLDMGSASDYRGSTAKELSE